MNSKKPNTTDPTQAPFRLDGIARVARRAYLEHHRTLGSTLLKLHIINAAGECTCGRLSSTRVRSRKQYEQVLKEGLTLPCKNPGKHLVQAAHRSIMTDLEDIEAHLDCGGAVGLNLRIDGLPLPPLRFVVFDCDREGSMEWLERRGIRSPLEVYGRRGKHVIGLLPDDCPDLRSDTKTLNPGSKNPTSEEQPGIDIKVSGYVVIPYSPNKRLFLNGKDITGDPEAIREVFGSLESLQALLPRIDPRVLVPSMKEVQSPTSDDEEESSEESASSGSRKKERKDGDLSTKRLPKEALYGPYADFPYYYRKDLARRFVKKLAPAAVSGSNPDETAFKICCILRHRHLLSEQDMLDLLMKYYNPRCSDGEGGHSIFQRKQLIDFIWSSGKEGTYDPLWHFQDPSIRPAAVEQVLEKLHARNRRSNDYKRIKRDAERAVVLNEISAFLSECCSCTDAQAPTMPLAELHAAYAKWMDECSQHTPVSSSNMARMLVLLGIEFRRVGKQKKQYVKGIIFRRRWAA